jgi:hypothetical protein
MVRHPSRGKEIFINDRVLPKVVFSWPRAKSRLVARRGAPRRHSRCPRAVSSSRAPLGIHMKTSEPSRWSRFTPNPPQDGSGVAYRESHPREAIYDSIPGKTGPGRPIFFVRWRPLVQYSNATRFKPKKTMTTGLQASTSFTDPHIPTTFPRQKASASLEQ